MTRTAPSALDLTLIAQAAELGRKISPAQLERWRARAWLPPTEQWTDPHTASIRRDILHRAARLADASTPGRSISWIGWTFWAIDDTPQTASRLRQALITTLKRPFARAGIDITRIPTGQSKADDKARQELVRQLLDTVRAPRRDLDGTLRAHALDADVVLPPPRSVPNVFHRSLLTPGARLLVGGLDDVPPEELLEAWHNALPPARQDMTERIRNSHLRAALAGQDPMAGFPLAYGLPGLIRIVEETDDRLLCAAVRACTKASATLAMLMLRPAHDAAVLARLMQEEMWHQWARVTGIAPHGAAGEAALTASTLHYLTVPGWTDDLSSYQELMDSLLTPAAEPCAPRPDDDHPSTPPAG